jgi:zinc transporter ZupT
VNLVAETFAISANMIVLCSLPLLSAGVRRHAHFFFLLGTGALAGICFFDLLPEVWSMGGQSSLGLVALAWLIYSGGHILHLRSHGHDPVEPTGTGVVLFLASMIAHCLVSGMLLALSDRLSGGIGKTVFLAMVAHKSYESLTVSSILLERQKSRWASMISISLYALSLPVGVVLTVAFGSALSPTTSMVITSLAVGALLGCLIHDFLLPSITRVKSRRVEIGWIAVGLALTQAVMRAL